MLTESNTIFTDDDQNVVVFVKPKKWLWWVLGGFAALALGMLFASIVFDIDFLVVITIGR